ncbi:MAG TPA: LpxI family protein [Planctomycetaceae bacterium]|nr:LpxI family protein [Planctomycetaceae bacterium]
MEINGRVVRQDESLAVVGLLAGWGMLPLEVAASLKARGARIVCAALKGHADTKLADLCDHYRVFGIARLGAQIRFFRRYGVRHATMAGKVFKAQLMYHRWGWLHYLPDWRCVRAFYPYFVTGSRDRKDDSLLGAVVNEFAKDGIMFQPATDLVPELLLAEGHWAGPPLTAAQIRDIAFGWQIAKELGRLDIGQSVAVKGQSCLAVEAIEGTDACIRRAGELCAQGGFVVVKVAKPQQDMRFDVPTIGLGTLETMRQAGATVLAVEADRTIIVERTRVLKRARQWGIRLVAVHHGDASQLRPAPKRLSA